MPILDRRSPHRPRPHRRCHLALLHRLPGSDLLGCGFAGRQFLPRGFHGRGHRWCLRLWGGYLVPLLGCGDLSCRDLGRRRLGRRDLRGCGRRCHLGRRVFGRRSRRGVIGRGSWGKELPGRRVSGRETLRYRDPRREQLGLGKLAQENCGPEGPGAVAARRPSVKGWSAAGSSGASTGPAFAVLRAAAQGRPRWEQFRSKCSQPCCPQEEAAGGSEKSFGEQWPINRQQQGRHANGDHASECDQGGGDDETQMRVQGPSPSGRPRAAPISGQEQRRRDYVRLGAGSQRKSKLCLTPRGPLGLGRDHTETRAQRENLQSGQSSDSGHPAGICQTPRSTLDWLQQRRMAVDI